MTAKFVCKATSLEEVKAATGNEKRYAIAAEIELTARESRTLKNRFLADQEFIEMLSDEMKCEDGVYHCILAKVKGATDGLLIYSAGYAYPRYAAYYAG